MLTTDTFDASGRPVRLEGDAAGQPDGYVLPMFALLLLPLLGFAALAVDLGAWYVYAAKVEAATDAAALAGVVYLPDEGTAETEARRVAAMNGFTHDPGGSGITVNATDLGNQQLRVEIHTPQAGQFFSQLFTDDVDVDRTSRAEYVLPVALGSPRNFLGTGDDPGNRIPPAYEENFWLSIGGPCSSRENGDLLAPISDANFDVGAGNPGPPGNGSGGWNRCTPAAPAPIANPFHDADGYFYAIEVPSDQSQLRIHVYDPNYCDASGIDRGGGSGWNTRFSVRLPDSTPYNPSNNPVLAGSVRNMRKNNNPYCGGGWPNQWNVLQTISPAPAGVYFVQVEALDPGMGANEQHAWGNQFSLAADYGSWGVCSSDQAGDPSIYDADCPGVHGSKWMSVYNDAGGNADGQADFFLADIGPEHSGKKLKIRLWDPGEGAKALQVLNPAGDPESFDWEIVNESGSDTAPSGVGPHPGWSGSSGDFTTGGVFIENGLDILGDDPLNTCRGWNPQPGERRSSRSKYSDRMVEIEIDLPDDIADAYGGATWWKVRYTKGTGCGGTGVTDRTTWSAQVSGDPVRLIPDN